MDKLIVWFQKYFYTIWGLLLGYLLIILIIISPTYQFTTETIPNLYIRLSIYLILLIIFTLIWFYIKNKFPKNKKGKVGILIAIETENMKQKTRIKKDLIQGIEELLLKENLINLFNIIVTNDYQTKRIIAYIAPYISRMNQIKQDRNIIINKKNKPSEYLIWEKIEKKVRAHLYIYGEVIERQDIENKYFIKFGALIKHKSVGAEISNNFSKEISLLLSEQISFYEKLEFRGFKWTTELLYLAIKYIVGVAAFISGDIKTSYLLHNELNKQLQYINPPIRNINMILRNLRKWQGTELLLLSKYEYSINKDNGKAINLLTKASNILPNDYSILIFKSYLAFDLERNSPKSLNLLDEAKKYSKNNYVWLYNRAFILMYDGNFEKGFEDYENISSLNSIDENIIVNECIDYDIALYAKEPHKKQCLFMIAYLSYQKLKNYDKCLEYFELFINETDKKEEFSFLRNKSFELLNLIKVNKKVF